METTDSRRFMLSISFMPLLKRGEPRESLAAPATLWYEWNSAERWSPLVHVARMVQQLYGEGATFYVKSRQEATPSHPSVTGTLRLANGEERLLKIAINFPSRNLRPAAGDRVRFDAKIC